MRAVENYLARRAAQASTRLGALDARPPGEPHKRLRTTWTGVHQEARHSAGPGPPARRRTVWRVSHRTLPGGPRTVATTLGRIRPSPAARHARSASDPARAASDDLTGGVTGSSRFL